MQAIAREARYLELCVDRLSAVPNIPENEEVIAIYKRDYDSAVRAMKELLNE